MQRKWAEDADSKCRHCAEVSCMAQPPGFGGAGASTSCDSVKMTEIFLLRLYLSDHAQSAPSSCWTPPCQTQRGPGGMEKVVTPTQQ